MIKVQLPDGTILDHQDSASALDVAAGIGERLAKATIAASINGTVVDSMRPLADLTDVRPVPLKLITERDAEALGVMRHSCAHVMARAVMRLFPGVGLEFGPTTGHGFYYDFDLKTPISEDDFPRIEAEMQKIIEAEKSDLFDVLRYVAFALTPLTREERAIRAKLEISTHFDSKQRAFLDFVLAQYVKEGVGELDQGKLSPLLKLKYNNAIADAIADLGQPEQIKGTFAEFQKYLYQPLVS